MVLGSLVGAGASSAVMAAPPTETPTEAPTEAQAEAPGESAGQAGSTLSLTPAWISVEVEGFEDATFRRQLELRVPGVELLERDAARERARSDTADPASEEAVLYGQLSVLVREDDVAITLLLSDGRAYDRTTPPGEVADERSVATQVATLIRSASEGSPPDRRVEAIDLSRAEGPGAPEGGEKDESEAGEDRDDDAGAALGDGGDGEASDPTSRRGELLVHLGGGMTLGLLPAQDIDRGIYGSAQFGIDVIWPGGGLVTTDVSYLGRGSPLGVHRARGALGGGYRWRRGAFELISAALIEVEGWWIVSDLELRRNGLPVQGRAPLLGLRAQLRPGWRPKAAPSLRLGASLELAGRTAFSDQSGNPRIVSGTAPTENPETLARLGGFELGLGLELGWGFALGPKPPR